MEDFKPLDLFGNHILTDNSFDKSEQDETILQDKMVEESEIKKNMELVSETSVDENCITSKSVDEDVFVKLITMYEELSKQIASMEILFNKRIMHTDYEDKIIDQMHEELQKYKEDLYSKLVCPILIDIIEVRDSIMRISATYLKNAEGEQRVPNKIFADYAFDLQDILEKNNVEIYHSNCGETFVPVKQRIVKKEATQDESLHGKIAESLSCGYSYGGYVISAEKVVIYYYEKIKENRNESEDNSNG